MGFGNGFYKQVPDNIALDTSSPLFDNIVDNKVNLYVSTTGDDTYGDGSLSNPYATPQRAVDSIPDNLEASTSVEISCGAGTFEFPDTSNLQPRIKVTIVGDTSNPVFSIPAGTVSFNIIAGKQCRLRGNVGAYAESITDGSHWMLIDFSIFNLGKVAYVVQSSTSPEIDIVGNVEGGSYTDFADSVIYEYATTFTIKKSAHFAKATSSSEKELKTPVVLLGIVISGTNVNPRFEGISFQGCKFVSSAGYFNPEMSKCVISSFVDSDITIALTNQNSVLESYIKGNIAVKGPSMSFRSCLIKKTISLSGKSFCSMVYTDFEDSGICVRARDSGSAYFYNCSVASTRDSFINVSRGNCFFSIVGTIVGSVTGNAIVLRNGSQVTGAKTYCNGTLTAGEYEIVLGGDATEPLPPDGSGPTGRTFASLPATDLDATYPELCRAD